MRVRLVHTLREQEIQGELDGFELTGAVAQINFGTLIGKRRFNLNHGFGLETMKEWRVHEDDLEELRDRARKEGHKVKPVGRSPGRTPKPKTGPKPHPKQLHFGDINFLHDDDR